MLAALGFPTARTPCQSTLRRRFRQRDGDALVAALTACFAPCAVSAAALQGIAIDGTAQRGRLRFPGGGGPVHAPSAVCHDWGVVLAHEPISAAGADKGGAELTVAPALLARIDWHGRVLTGDALFDQRAICRQVLAAGGDFVLAVKENQGRLDHDLRLLCDPPPDVAAPPGSRRGPRFMTRSHLTAIRP